jgi:hypothetical protein
MHLGNMTAKHRRLLCVVLILVNPALYVGCLSYWKVGRGALLPLCEQISHGVTLQFSWIALLAMAHGVTISESSDPWTFWFNLTGIGVIYVGISSLLTFAAYYAISLLIGNRFDAVRRYILKSRKTQPYKR